MIKHNNTEHTTSRNFTKNKRNSQT